MWFAEPHPFDPRVGFSFFDGELVLSLRAIDVVKILTMPRSLNLVVNPEGFLWITCGQIVMTAHQSDPSGSVRAQQEGHRWR